MSFRYCSSLIVLILGLALPGYLAGQCDPDGVWLERQSYTSSNGLLLGQTGCVKQAKVITPLQVSNDTLRLINGVTIGYVLTWNGTIWVPAATDRQTISAGDGAGSDKTIVLSDGGGAVVLRPGSNVTISRTVDTITIGATPGAGVTDLTYSGTSSPVTLNSSTGTDVTFTQGAGVTITATGTDLNVKADTSILATNNDINAINCRWCSVKKAMPFYSNSPQTAFEALRTYWASRMGEIVVDTTVLLTANTTVAAAVRFEGGGNINVDAGHTLTFQSTVDAEPKHFVFTGAGTYAFDPKSTKELYVYWFGAMGNNSNDDVQEIQKCVDAAISSKINTVRLLSGYHLIGSPGILIRNGSSTVTMTLQGNINNDADLGTALIMTDSTNFAIGIQGGRQVVIKNMYLRGVGSGYNPTIAQVISNTKAQWATQYGRDNRYSPFSAIVIDPFKTTAPSGGGYPGYSAQYSNSHSLSSNVHIENVVCRYFIVGCMISPSGANGNGAEIFLKNSVFDRCEYGLATANTQSRTVDVTGCLFSFNAACLDGTTFGGQASPLPNIIGGQFSNAKDILRYNASQGSGRISNVYTESIYRLGRWNGNSGAPLNFVNCEFNFATSSETGLPDAASVLDAPNINVNFIGGSLVYSTSRPVEMNARYVCLRGVNLNRTVLNNPSGNSLESRVIYEGCQIAGYSSQFAGSLVSPVINGIDLQRSRGHYQVPGQKIVYYELLTNNLNTATFTNTNDAEDHAVLLTSSTTVTVDTTARTATFTVAIPERYRVGDILFTYNNNTTATPSATSKTASFGIVTNISGTTVTCGHIPSGIVSGTYSIYLWAERIFTGTWLANMTSASNKLVIVSKPTTGATVAQAWPAGTRVYSKSNQSPTTGLYTGLYVVSVTADTITLSAAVGSTASNLEIFSADYRCEYWSEDNTFQNSGSTHRTVGYQTGDRIIFKSHSYRASAIVTAGGFTPTVKFIFKPLSGLASAKPTPTVDDAGLTYFSTDTDALEIWDGTAWNAQDASAVNEAWTVDADDADTELITTQTVKFEGAGGIVTDWNPATNILSISGAGIGGYYQTWRDDGVSATQQPNANFVSNSDIAFTLANDGANAETEVTADIPANAVDDAELRQSTGLSVIGRSANTTGNVADITAASDGQVLRRSGTAIGFGAVDLAGANAVTGTLAVGNGGTGATNLVNNRVLTGNGTSAIVDEANFTFDGTDAAILSGKITVNKEGVFNDQNANKAYIGSPVSGVSNFPGVWLINATPSTSNYALARDIAGLQTALNAVTSGHIALKIANGEVARMDGTGLGIGNTSPQRKLHVTGEARITDLGTDTPTKIVGADADGDLDTVGIGAEAELHITGGTLGTNFHTTIAPAQLTAGTTNNWNPTGLSTAWIIELSGDNKFEVITGIVAPTFNKTITLYNTGTNSVLFAKEFTTSTAANRFNFELVLFPGKNAQIRYSISAARWTLVSTADNYRDVEHLYFNESFNAPVSITPGDYDFWNIISESAASLVAPVAGRMKGLSVNTGTSASGKGSVSSKEVFFENDGAAGTATWTYCKAVIKTPAALSDGTNDYSIRVGFNVAVGGAGTTDGYYFQYNHSLVSGNWGTATTNAGNTELNNSGVAVAASTVYVLEVIFRPNAIVEYFINGTRVASNSTFIATGDDMLVAAEIEKSLGTTSRDITVYTLQTQTAFVD